MQRSNASALIPMPRNEWNRMAGLTGQLPELVLAGTGIFFGRLQPGLSFQTYVRRFT